MAKSETLLQQSLNKHDSDNKWRICENLGIYDPFEKLFMFYVGKTELNNAVPEYYVQNSDYFRKRC